METKISIITPSYNQGEYIEQTIDSVLSQNYPNLEYIIIDGGSTDNSIELISKYQKFLKFWISEPDLGQSHAINKGLSHATGQVINWLNSDDYYQPNTLHLVADAFKSKGVSVVCGKGNVVSKGKILRINQGSTCFENSLPKSIAYGRIDQAETFFRSDIFHRIGGLNIQLNYCMDKELWMKYLMLYGQKGICRIDKELANFRMHDDSKSVSHQNRFFEERNLIFAQIAKTYNLTEISNTFINLNQELTTCHDSSWLQKHKFSLDFIYQILYEGLLLVGEELYAASKYKAAEKVLNIIDKSHITNEGLKKLKLLALRTKFIPSTLIDFWRLF